MFDSFSRVAHPFAFQGLPAVKKVKSPLHDPGLLHHLWVPCDFFEPDRGTFDATREGVHVTVDCVQGDKFAFNKRLVNWLFLSPSKEICFYYFGLEILLMVAALLCYKGDKKLAEAMIFA